MDNQNQEKPKFEFSGTLSQHTLDISTQTSEENEEEKLAKLLDSFAPLKIEDPENLTEKPTESPSLPKISFSLGNDQKSSLAPSDMRKTEGQNATAKKFSKIEMNPIEPSFYKENSAEKHQKSNSAVNSVLSNDVLHDTPTDPWHSRLFELLIAKKNRK